MKQFFLILILPFHFRIFVKGFEVLVFGGENEEICQKAFLYNVNEIGITCKFPQLPNEASFKPFGAIINDNFTICGGNLDNCLALHKHNDQLQWSNWLGVRAKHSSAVTTFDMKKWSFLGGKDSEQTLQFWREDQNEFISEDLPIKIEGGACTVRFNHSHAIIAQGSKNVYWYEEEGFRIKEFNKQGFRKASDAFCGLVFTEEDGYQFVISGGTADNEEILSHTDIYYFDSHKWTEGAMLDVPRRKSAFVQYQNTFVVLGAQTEDASSFNVMKYDQLEGWNYLPMTLAKGNYDLGALHIVKGAVECDRI